MEGVGFSPGDRRTDQILAAPDQGLESRGSCPPWALTCWVILPTFHVITERTWFLRKEGLKSEGESFCSILLSQHFSLLLEEKVFQIKYMPDATGWPSR